MPSAAVSTTISSAFDTRPLGGAAAPPAPNAQPVAAKPAPGAATAKAGKAAKRAAEPESFAKALSRAADGAEPAVQRAQGDKPPAEPVEAAPAVVTAGDAQDEQPKSEPASPEEAAPDVAHEPIGAGTREEAPETRGDAGDPPAAADEAAPAVRVEVAAPAEAEVVIAALPAPVASDLETVERTDRAARQPGSEAVSAPNQDAQASAASEGARAPAVRASPSPEPAQSERSSEEKIPAKSAGRAEGSATHEPRGAEAEPLPKAKAEEAAPVAAVSAAASERAGDEGSSTESGKEGAAQERDASGETVAPDAHSAEPAPRAHAPARKVAPERDADREPVTGQSGVVGQSHSTAGAPEAGAKGAPSSVFTFEGLRVGGVSVGAGGPQAARGASPQSRAAAAESDLSRSAFEATVSRGLGVAVNQRGGAVTIRLQPESLGAMRIHLDIEQGLVQGRFEVATPEARDLLSKSMDTLRTALESRGLSVDRLQVHLASPNEGSTGRGAQDQGDRQGAGARQDAADGRSRGSFEGGGPGGRERDGQPRSGGFEELWGLAGAERPAEPLGLPPWSGAGRLAVDAVG